MRPLDYSNPCKFTFSGTLTSGRKLTSDCGVWIAFVGIERLVDGEPKKKCPLCEAGRQASCDVSDSKRGYNAADY